MRCPRAVHGILRATQGLPTSYPRDTRALTIGYPWATHGMPMGHPWDAHRTPMDYPYSHGMLMGCPWVIDGGRSETEADHCITPAKNRRYSLFGDLRKICRSRYISISISILTKNRRVLMSHTSYIPGVGLHSSCMCFVAHVYRYYSFKSTQHIYIQQHGTIYMQPRAAAVNNLILN